MWQSTINTVPVNWPSLEKRIVYKYKHFETNTRNYGLQNRVVIIIEITVPYGTYHDAHI